MIATQQVGQTQSINTRCFPTGSAQAQFMEGRLLHGLMPEQRPWILKNEKEKHQGWGRQVWGERTGVS